MKTQKGTNRTASAGPGNAFDHPAWQRHVWSAPDVSLLIGPGVDRVAVTNQVEHMWFPELVGGPLVQALQPRHDHPVVEQPAKTLLSATYHSTSCSSG